MVKVMWCWRCQMDIPMLETMDSVNLRRAIRRRLLEEKIDITASDNYELFQKIELDEYNKITGIDETNNVAILHHTVTHFGPPCTNCGRPLRTPQAKICVACNTPVFREVT